MTGHPFRDSNALRIPFIHELKELVRHKYLLSNLVSRGDLKVPYKRSALGFLWAMIVRRLTMEVLMIRCQRLSRQSSEGVTT